MRPARSSRGAEFAYGEAVEGNFDDVFGFGAGNQHVGTYFEFESPEFLFAGEMLRWFAIRAAGDQGEEALGVGAGDLLFGMGVKPGAVAAQHMKKQQLGRQRIGWNMLIAQLGEPLLQCGADVSHSFTLAK